MPGPRSGKFQTSEIGKSEGVDILLLFSTTHYIADIYDK